MAYLSQVRSGGKQYIYLTEYCGNQEFTSKKEKNIYGFGNIQMAFLKMKIWEQNFERDFPRELRELGYTQKDLKQWIKQIETGVTKSGRKFKIDDENRAIFKYNNILNNVRGELESFYEMATKN